ncbi:hypothetical protein HG530_004958 [Fusarium avenaceum]|nr:hypothetical protein HG530_004958 [Fusarium avenaceum]
MHTLAKYVTYCKNDIVQKENFIKVLAFLIQVNQVLQRPVPQLGEKRYPPQLALSSGCVDPALSFVRILNLILMRRIRHLHAVRDPQSLELLRHLVQLSFCLIPAAALEHTNKDVFLAKHLGNLYHRRSPVVPYHALVVEVHAGDVDALGGLRELRSRRAVGIEKVFVDSEDVENVYDDNEDKNDLGEA